MELTIKLSTRQASALIHAVSTCLHLADKSPNTGSAYGIDLTLIKTLNSALESIENAIPQPSPPQTNEPCNTPEPTT